MSKRPHPHSVVRGCTADLIQINGFRIAVIDTPMDAKRQRQFTRKKAWGTSRAALATTHDRHYLMFDEFRAICEGAVLAGRG
jgi:hypothetical protein